MFGDILLVSSAGLEMLDVYATFCAGKNCNCI